MADLLLDALERAERFMSGFEDDELQEGIPADLAVIRAARALLVPRDVVVASARKLLEAVDFDNSGVMVGMVRTGGNGGLISHDTTKAADALRLVLSTLPNQQEAHHG